MFSTIVAPVDGTEPSENALRYASELSTKYGARLILVHVLLRGDQAVVASARWSCEVDGVARGVCRLSSPVQAGKEHRGTAGK